MKAPSAGGGTPARPAGRPPGRRKRVIWSLTAVLAVAALGLVFGVRLRGGAPSDASAADPPTRSMDIPAPSLAGRTLTGPSFDLATLRGRPVLVNVWASWCDGCRDELRVLHEAARRWTGRGLRIVGINARDDDSRARALLADLGAASFTTVVDHDGTIAVDWGVRGVPETFLVDRVGRLRLGARGAITEAWLRRWIEPRIAS